jgi:hypothetical protein
MKKEVRRRLNLSRAQLQISVETVRYLSTDDLASVAGASGAATQCEVQTCKTRWICTVTR